MNKIRCAVIGVGYLGRFHAQKYQLLPNADLIAVCDVNPEVCKAVAQECTVDFCLDFKELFGRVDAVSIAATSNKHYDIAKACLAQGIHVLIEKPITETIAQAKELVALAKQHQVKLQVGHLERFNSASLGIKPYIQKPLFIEAQRLAPFNLRGSDVNVVFDIMIHDIDLILNMVQSPIISLEAYGAPVITKDIDIANVRMTFANHCVANLTASRVNSTIKRKTNIFQADSYLAVDYQTKKVTLSKKGTGELFPGVADIENLDLEFETGDALFEEIKAFLKCVEQDSMPIVSGEDGLYALETAEKITSLIHKNLIKQNAEH